MVSIKVFFFNSFWVVFFLATSSSCYATEEIAPIFGSGGVVITDFGLGDDAILDMVIQQDEKIVVVGYSYNGAVKNVAIARYLANGTLDPEFANIGHTTLSFGLGDSVANAVAIENDGKIVVTGSSFESDSEVFVARLTVNGVLDTSFGESGWVTMSDPNFQDIAKDIVISEGNEFFVTGTSIDQEDNENGFIYKLSSEGVLDNDFGKDGKFSMAARYNIGFNSVQLAGDNIVIGGYSFPSGQSVATCYKITKQGQLDTVFGDNGKIIIEQEKYESSFYNLMILSDGSLVAIGFVHNGKYQEPLIVKFLTSGDYDLAFGSEGIVQKDLGYGGIAYAVGQLQNGNLVVTGTADTPDGKEMFLIQINSDGDEVQEDSSSTLLEASALTVDTIQSTSATVAVTSSGAVLSAGSTGSGDDEDFTVVQYSASTESSTESKAVQGVTTGDYTVTTYTIIDITRTSGFGGGAVIDKTNSSEDEETCEANCQDDSSSDYQTCYDDCLSSLITMKGLCFSDTPHPVYNPDEESEEEDLEDEDAEDDSAGIFPISDNEDDEENSNKQYKFKIVTSGQTDEGEGTGQFASLIEDVSPDTLYFVRAYAVLSDDSVIYGNEVVFTTNDACFIATAAFGSILNDHVKVLRSARDRYLKGTLLGSWAIKEYYTYSPTIAEAISNNSVVKGVVRILLYPIILIAYLILALSFNGFLLLLIGMIVLFTLYKIKRCKRVQVGHI